LSDLPPSVFPPDELPPPKEPIFRIPPATGWLIAINILVHLVRQILPAAQDELVVNQLGFNASSVYGPFGPLDLLSLFTYQFLHGGWDHLGVNMVSLLAFGAGVERPIGKLRFVALYITCGVAGALFESLFAAPRGDDVLIGASASISGVFGALIIIWSLHRQGSHPMGMLPTALLWIGLMAITGILGVGAQGSPVAWLAHIGGFLAGMALGFIFRPKNLLV